MNKEKFLGVYNGLQIFIGLILFLFVAIFVTQLPDGAVGNIVPKFFVLRVEESGGYYRIFNIPLFLFISLFVLNVFMMIRVKDTSDVKKKYLVNVVLYNTLLSFMFVVGHVAFMLMLPDGVAGNIVNNFIMITIDIRGGGTANVPFLGYLLTAVYFLYNIVVAYLSRDAESLDLEDVYDVNAIKELKETGK